MIAASLALLPLTGCDSAREAFGFERSAPDEFAVVSRQPLSIPPNFRLRPPEPGAPRPAEVSTRAQTEALVLGSGDPSAATGVAGVSPGESALLSRSGADQAPSDIRQRVDRETADIIDSEDNFADAILFWVDQEPPGTVLDPSQEARLLRESSQGGPAIGDTEIPVIERRQSTILDSIF